jgi:flagellar biosynthesis/type III secretory pathway M-ring protein FliF/YscJ
MASSQTAMFPAPSEPAMAEIEETSQVSTTEQVQNRIAEIMTRNVPSAEDEQLQKVLSQMVEESPATVAEIIQMWLNED